MTTSPLLHIVRTGAAPLAVAREDLVVYSDGSRWRLATEASHARDDASEIDDDRLHQLIFAAGAVVVW